MDISAGVFKVLLIIKLKCIEICYTWIGRIMLKLKGVKSGKGILFSGKTFFFRAPNSKIEIGNEVVFRSDSSSNLIGINHRCMISTLERDAYISIGDKTGFSGVSIGAANRIVIGKNVLVGANTMITDNNWHNLDPENRDLSDQKKGSIEIKDNVFIGYGCIILKNVTIGENSVIGSGSVVIQDIPANVIAAGNPCKVIKPL